MSVALSPDLMAQLSQLIASRMGLHFPQERWGDLANRLVSVARQHGLKDAEAYVRRLLSSPFPRREIEVLASYLTVGETYFFREENSFGVLEGQVFPELIRLHRGNGLSLRIWSAGCCTGEEPYSIAMLLDRMIPDLTDWNITILATDINPRYLEIASVGAYGEWSFRSVPWWIRERYFSRLPGGRMQIARGIRRMVTFSYLNLAEDVYPSLVNNTNAMDLVLCRNVLMYFTPENAERVVENLHGSLVENGWLLVAPSETSQTLFRRFATISFPGAILYRRPAGPILRPPSEEIGPVDRSKHLFPEEEMPPGAEDRREEPASPPDAQETVAPIVMARTLANRGELLHALSWCDQAVLADPLSSAHRFLRAMVAQELGRLDEATKFLEQALYLDQEFVMAHFALGNVAKRLGRRAVSRRHFRWALSLMEGLEPDVAVPESAGLTAGRLMEIIRLSLDGEP
jgi:chemotaxis protein methyltransferase CheR